MSASNTNLKTGEWVEVKSPAEIAETLDVEGTLAGLPFMPEMEEYCGRRFRVLRRAEKTCIEYPGGGYKVREFLGNDVVLLDGLRCSGANHDGCQRQCTLFWKRAWLRKVEGERPVSTNPSGDEALRSKMKTMSTASRYFCQSTELAKATRPLTRARILLKCFYDIGSGSRGAWEMAGLVFAPLWRKVTEKIPRRRLKGNLTRTPVGDLKLQSGEWVQIRTEAEIAQTLDGRGRNRGLICDFGMSQYGGGKYQVRTRLDRMISEATGEMRQVDGTVILEGLNCLCWNVLGGCPRQDFMYWRELWLERASVGSNDRAASQCSHDGPETSNEPICHQ
jgi:hypothetical protein